MNFDDLQGKRIDLIELNMEGLLDMHEYSINPSFYRYMEYEPHNSIEGTRQYLNKLINRSSSDSGHYWFIFLKDQKKIIGSFGLLNVDRRKGSAEIGYGISPDYWGHGYFNEALLLVINYLFIKLYFNRICVITQVNNAPSIKALERVGFKKEGVMREYYLSMKNSNYYDAAMLALLKSDYLLMEQKS